MKTFFKFFIILGFILAVPNIYTYGQLSINTDLATPDASAMLDVKSTTSGMLIPRMTAVQRAAISSPAEGLLVYQTDGSAGFYFRNGNDWKFLGFKSGDGFSSNVIDMDGNVYPTTMIGNQEWMAENLRVTHYRNGEAILNIVSSIAWNLGGDAGYCWYNNNASANKLLYGSLYNWYAVTDSRNICPNGWHVPNDAEWTTLITYLGGDLTAGGKMKADILWNSPNTNATNISSFSGNPGGYRLRTGGFSSKGDYGYYWSTTAGITGYAWHRDLSANGEGVWHYDDEQGDGMSVRCLRDN